MSVGGLPANTRYLMVAPDVAASISRYVPSTSVSGLLAFVAPGVDVIVSADLPPGMTVPLDADRQPIPRPVSP